MAAVCTTGAVAQDLGSGVLPLRFSAASPLAIDSRDQIVVRGHVHAPQGGTIVLRIDDGQSTSYASRVNLERTLPQGAFSWALPVAGMRTSGGRVLASGDIRKVFLFATANIPVDISKFAIEPATRLPDGVLALSLGRAEAPLFPGFERVSPGDRRIEAGRPIPVQRPGLDPLIASGLRGVERIRVAWPQKRARISLWTEDVGEWETLPVALERRIRVNGVDIAAQRLTPAQWIAQRYLAGRDREASALADAWEVYGRHRGGLISTDIDVPDGTIAVELAGDSAVSTFLAAVLIEPAGQRASLDAVQNARAAWFRSAWPVAATGADGRDDAKPSEAMIDIGNAAVAPTQSVTIAPDTGTRIAFSLRSESGDAEPEIRIIPPSLGGKALDVTLRTAQWRLERRATGGNILERRADYLRDPASLPMHAQEPRRFVGWISAGATTPPGLYRGSIAVRAAGMETTVPIAVQVLDLRLPPAPRPAGFYLDEAPHLTWFADQAPMRQRQIACDLTTLGRFGVFGNAPPLTTPMANRKAAFLADSRIALQNATAAPWLAYSPLKRLVAETGTAAAMLAVKEAHAALRDQGLPAPVWSLADEPGNPDQNATLLSELPKDLRRNVAGIRLGGQFNHPNDRRFLPLVDTAIINAGFGIERDTVKGLQRQGLDVWIYNTGRPRVTAGFWLWHTGATRYVQWHARMPTADPFDPTDGREGDVHIFPPAAVPCPEAPDFHRDLIAMAEGVVDQRWLAWLDTRPDAAAVKLRHEIEVFLDRPWKELSDTTEADLDGWRRRIIELARTLK